MMHRKLNSFKNGDIISILLYFVFLLHIFVLAFQMYTKKTDFSNA